MHDAPEVGPVRPVQPGDAVAAKAVEAGGVDPAHIGSVFHSKATLRPCGCHFLGDSLRSHPAVPSTDLFKPR